MADNRLRVGVITTTHGIRGEVKVFPTTDDPHRFLDLDQVYISQNSQETVLHIEKVRFFKKQVIVKFKEISDINDVEQYRKADILIDRESAEPLEEDEFYIDDLLGLEVYTDEDRYLGKLKDVYETGANDIYSVADGKKELLIPATKECVCEVNLEDGKMVVHLLPGLEELNS